MALLDFSYFEADKYSFNIVRLGFITEILGEFPGGARDSHESALEAALRESNEEIGIDSKLVTARFTHLDDHGDWSYETIVASLEVEGFAFENNHETIDLQWFEISEVKGVNLHPSFARSWPSISVRLVDIAG